MIGHEWRRRRGAQPKGPCGTSRRPQVPQALGDGGLLPGPVRVRPHRLSPEQPRDVPDGDNGFGLVGLGLIVDGADVAEGGQQEKQERRAAQELHRARASAGAANLPGRTFILKSFTTYRKET